MSFLIITDPTKREANVKEFLDLKKRIKDNFRSERMGEMEAQTDLSKFFKPITETQKATTKEITEGLKPITEGIKSLPQAITFPAFPSIEASKDPIEGEDTQFIGDLAEKYLRKFATKTEADRTYGLYDRKGNFYIGNKPVVIIDNNIIVDDEEYPGTPGLWVLIVSKNPKYGSYIDEDKANYTKLMIKINALHRNNNPETNHPKSSKGDKWNNILSGIWKKVKKGSGVIIIPEDPNALLERLDLLLSSQEAGQLEMNW